MLKIIIHAYLKSRLANPFVYLKLAGTQASFNAQFRVLYGLLIISDMQNLAEGCATISR